jgi:hypothetical protein
MRNSIRRAIAILGALIVLLPAAIFGQDKPTLSADMPTGSAQKSTPPASAKPAKEATCDGALEIVPSQPLTFVRKRRPAKNTPTSTETKAEKKQAGETQN